MLQKLEDTRSALRRELMPPVASDPDAGAPRGAAGPLRGIWRLWRRLRRSARNSPIAAVLTEAASDWWRRQPWRASAALLGEQVRPLARRHPLGTVAVAAVAGAAIVGLRPWRWKAVDVHLRPMPGLALAWLLNQFSSLPMQTALASLALMAMASEESRGAGPAPEQPEASDGSRPDTRLDARIDTRPEARARSR